MTRSLGRARIISMIQFVSLLGGISFLPLFHQQWLTGPIVNAVLIVTVSLLGVQNAILLGLIPSTIALSVGLLPAPLAPMIPFIIISNAIYVLGFNYFREKNFFGGIVVGSVLKFVFLWATSFIVVNLIVQAPIAAKVAGVMSWPQLATALIGGVIAYGFLKSIKKI